MKQMMLQEKYPVYALEIAKSETTFQTVDEVLGYLRAQIGAHPKVAYIATFDHYAHTRAIGGEIAGDIKDAKNIVFCFGVKLPAPAVLSVRPRSIGVADMGDSFHVTFMEAPMPVANEAMETWAKGIANK